MKKLWFTVLFILFFISCEKESTKNVYPNVEDSNWFKDIQSPCDENSVCKLRINKALYGSDTVYYSAYVGALCDMYFTAFLLNVHGDTIKKYIGPDELGAFISEVELIETIYRCEDK